MKGGVWPNVRLSVIALAAASTFAGALSPPALADPPPVADRVAPPRPASHPHTRAPRTPRKPAVDTSPASDAIVRTAVPPDLDQRRRDGHMTPEERRLLRQHIEDAVRELYKR
ncbi:hypothetical protein [Paraburkholderia rhizosphaerae]|nr:hypothetical protein [Paraburkholderia rhizosphaerae]